MANEQVKVQPASMANSNQPKITVNNNGNAVPVSYGTDANGNPTARAAGSAYNGTAVPVEYGTDANGNPNARAIPAGSGDGVATSPAQVTQSTTQLPTWNYSAPSIGVGGYVPTKWDRQAVFEKGGLDKYNAESESRINQLYEKGLERDLAALKNAYDMNRTTLQREYDQIAPQYQEARNQLAGQGEQAKRNMNMQGAASGVNTGTGSQMQLAQNVAMQQAQARLTSDEQRTITEAQQRITDLQVKYQNDVAQAIANNDYQLAAALLEEYKEQFNRAAQVESFNMQNAFHQDSMKAQYAQMALQASIASAQLAMQSEQMRNDNEWKTTTFNAQQAQQAIENQRYDQQYADSRSDREQALQLQKAGLLAGYGDFSGYTDLYGADAVNYMSDIWMRQNPSLAYSLGRISADDYLKLTGQYAPDVLAAQQEAAAAAAAAAQKSYGGYGGEYNNSGGGTTDYGGRTITYKGKDVGTGYTLEQADKNLQAYLAGDTNAPKPTRGAVARAAERGLSSGDLTLEQYYDLKYGAVR